jgi:ribosomal protein S18 acetylase RimI-like enzyme
MNLVLRKCTPLYVDELREIAYSTYDDAFRHLNTPENMQAYLDAAFERGKLLAELEDPGSAFYFLYMDDALVGYLKLNEGPSQTDLKDPDSLEIERIYVVPGWQGQGLGKYLIREALEIARRRGKRCVWLGVWEKNERAIVFYQRMGFRVIGTHEFIMGDERQTDYLMRLDFL